MQHYKLLNSKNDCIVLNYFFYHNPKLFNSIIEHFDSIPEIIEKKHEIIKAFKLRKTDFFNNLNTLNIDKQSDFIQKNNIKILTLNDENYPDLLKQITYPPPVLFAQGNLTCLSEKKLAIIGPRKPSKYAQDVTEHFTKILSHDFCIVSGFAEGIDTIAHTTTLNQENKTIAVIGAGLDQCYPATNHTLKKSILKNNGLFLSEIPLFFKPAKFHFPLRNRIISGLCEGTIITEAAIKSGSLITANYAIEQNREVFAIPGNIFENNSEGVHSLIKQGAKCTTTPQDIFDELNIKQSSEFISNKTKQKPKQNHENLSEKEALIIAMIQQPKHIDEIIEHTKLPIPELLQTLTFLEIKKYISKQPGSYYSLIES